MLRRRRSVGAWRNQFISELNEKESRAQAANNPRDWESGMMAAAQTPKMEVTWHLQPEKSISSKTTIKEWRSPSTRVRVRV